MQKDTHIHQLRIGSGPRKLWVKAHLVSSLASMMRWYSASLITRAPPPRQAQNACASARLHCTGVSRTSFHGMLPDGECTITRPLAVLDHVAGMSYAAGMNLAPGQT